MAIPCENLNVIYIIRNHINNKVYIGLTNDPQKRWRQHQMMPYNNKPLYKAMRKWGLENFSFQILLEGLSRKEACEKEIEYIKIFNSTNPNFGYNVSSGGENWSGQNNPRSILTEDEVEEIRNIYKEGKLSIRYVYPQYSDKISYSAFEKVWEGTTWKQIMPEVYTPENKAKHLKIRVYGEANGNAHSTNEEILQLRLYYVNHSQEEVFRNCKHNYSTKDSLRQALNYGYRDVPIYKKKEKKWYLYDEEINIQEYLDKRVSTISGSGE